MIYAVNSTKVNGGEGSVMALLGANAAQCCQATVMMCIIDYVCFGSREKLAAGGFYHGSHWTSGT